MIPKFSAPLTKSIRTLEGLLVLGSNVLLVIIPIVTSSLTAAQSVKYGVILNTGYAISRSVLKGIATLTSQGVPAPAQIVSAKTESAIESDAAALAGDAVNAEQWLANRQPVTATPSAAVEQPAPVPAPQPATPAPGTPA